MLKSNQLTLIVDLAVGEFELAVFFHYSHVIMCGEFIALSIFGGDLHDVASGILNAFLYRVDLIHFFAH